MTWQGYRVAISFRELRVGKRWRFQWNGARYQQNIGPFIMV